MAISDFHFPKFKPPNFLDQLKYKFATSTAYVADFTPILMWFEIINAIGNDMYLSGLWE